MSDIADIIGEDFNTEEYAKPAYDALPPGWYDVVIDQCEVKTTKAGNGAYMKVAYKVIGEHAGRLLFSNLNLKNPSAKAEEIGRRELGNLGSAVGVLIARDCTEFLGKMLQVKVVITDDKNEVKAVRASGACDIMSVKAPLNVPSVNKQEPVASKTTVTTKRPWEK